MNFRKIVWNGGDFDIHDCKYKLEGKMSNKIYNAYASILADLARDLLCLYADDHDTILVEFACDSDNASEFDSEVERISKRIDYLESKLKRAERTCKLICHEVEMPDSLKEKGVEMRVYECSECGERMFSDYNYCPACGAMVVEE